MKSIALNIAIRVAVVLLLTIQTAASKDSPYSGEVIAVSDGDTIKVLHNGISETVRLSGVDCPEKGQAFGNRAKQFTSDFCFGKQVLILAETRDRYGRTVADVVVPGGRSLNHELVQAGYAWWYQKYAATDEQLCELEKSARSRQAGLWVDPSPIAPWDLRQQSKRAHNGQQLVGQFQFSRRQDNKTGKQDSARLKRRLLQNWAHSYK